LVFGIVFVLLGLLGFVSNPIVGNVAIFSANVWHNMIHLLTGIILLAFAFLKPQSSLSAIKTFGVIYLVLTVFGFILVPTGGSLFGLILLNSADHFLNLLIGVILIIFAYAVEKKEKGLDTVASN
ncbi:MAG: DUF4383 domain-containing protein, partial [bacterium]